MSLFRDFSRERRSDAHYDYLTFADKEGGFGSGNTRAGMHVTQASSMGLPTVYRCVALNAETLSSMPVDCLAKRGDERQPYAAPGWLTRPNDEQDWDELVKQGQISYELDGNCFLLKAVDVNQRLVGLYVLAPNKVTPKRIQIDGRNRLVYEVDADGGKKTLAATSVIHIKGMVLPGQLRGLSPISACAETIGLGLAAIEFGGSFFGNGAHLSGVIESPEGAKKLGPEEIDRLKADFAYKHGGIRKSHAIGMLQGGAKWNPLTVKPEEAQFLETQRFNSVQIAHIFGCPPAYVADAEGAKGFVTGVVAMNQMWLQTGLTPRLVNWERRISALLPRPAYVKFNVNALLRSDPKDRAEYLGALWDRGVINGNEWRAIEDMDPREGGDVYYVPANFVPAGALS